MAETLPMLERDPRGPFRTSRMLRLAAFSLVASIVLVSLLLVAFGFIWNELVIPFAKSVLHTTLAPYQAQVLIVLPVYFIIAAVIGKIIWDEAEGRAARPRAR